MKAIKMSALFLITIMGTANAELESIPNQAEASHLEMPKGSAKRKFPHGCRELGFEFQSPLLLIKSNPKGQQQTLFLIHNITPTDIRLKDETAPRFSPNYEKIIPANSWAAFAFDSDLVQFNCSAAVNDENKFNCQHAVELCQYNNAKFPDQNFGTYWLEETGSRDETMEEAIQKGILLRW